MKGLIHREGLSFLYMSLDNGKKILIKRKCPKCGCKDSILLLDGVCCGLCGEIDNNFELIGSPIAPKTMNDFWSHRAKYLGL